VKTTRYNHRLPAGASTPLAPGARGFCRRAIGPRVLALLLILTATTAGDLATVAAQEAVAGWNLRGGLVAGANPTALGLTGSLERVVPLYTEREGLLWDSGQITPSLGVMTNPTFTDVVAQLYVEPIVFFDLTLAGGIRSFYTFAGLGFVPLEGYDADLPSATGDDFEGENQVGSFFSVTPRVKFAAGPILGTNAFSATYHNFSGADSSHMEEPITLTAIETSDWVFSNTTRLLYPLGEGAPGSQPRRRLLFAAAGVEYNINWVPAASSDDQPASHRVSAMGVGVWGLGEQSALEAAAFLGSHVTGEPIDATRPYVLTAVSLLRRF
jgi:hypothetical protein